MQNVINEIIKLTKELHNTIRNLEENMTISMDNGKSAVLNVQCEELKKRIGKFS